EKGSFLDRFPRTLPQARSLENIVAKLSKKIDYVMHLDVPQERLVQRLTVRRTCQTSGLTNHILYNPQKMECICNLDASELVKREDDTEETVKNRLEININQTQPLLDFYKEQDVLIPINGDQHIDDVFVEIEQKLK